VENRNGGESRFASLAAKAAAGELGEALYADDAGTGREAYVARMKANGRTVDLAGEGMNQNKDGIQFWGPVDNESSQAKAKNKVLSIDQWECITCGTCEENTKVVFDVPEEAKAQVLQQDGPMDLIQDAIDACPVTCISWIRPDDIEEQHSHGGFQQED
jgi:ferredoxin